MFLAVTHRWSPAHTRSDSRPRGAGRADRCRSGDRGLGSRRRRRRYTWRRATGRRSDTWSRPGRSRSGRRGDTDRSRTCPSARRTAGPPSRPDSGSCSAILTQMTPYFKFSVSTKISLDEVQFLRTQSCHAVTVHLIFMQEVVHV